MRIRDPAALELNRFKEGAANPHHQCAFHLILEMLWIHDSATLPGGDHALDLDRSSRPSDGDFRAAADITAFLEAAGRPEAARGRLFHLAPSEFLRGRLQNRPHALVFEILHPELYWVDAGGVG